MSATPRTNAVLDLILKESGILCETTAPKPLVRLARDLEQELGCLIQAAYNLSMFLRESVAPHDAGALSGDWPLKLVTSDENCSHRLAYFLQAQEQALKLLGCPVTTNIGGGQ
jgi:hypothetical protein